MSQKTFKIFTSASKAKLKTLFQVYTNENKDSGILQKAWKCIAGDVHSQGLRRLHRLWASLLANRFHTRKSHGFPLRVNPILVFAANQLSTTSTVTHCKSIGSSRAARSRQQKPNLDFSTRSCQPLSPERGQFAPRINISYLESLWTIAISRNSSGQHHSGRCAIVKSRLRTNFASCILPIYSFLSI